jgi:hypothetical protein
MSLLIGGLNFLNEKGLKTIQKYNILYRASPKTLFWEQDTLSPFEG